MHPFFGVLEFIGLAISRFLGFRNGGTLSRFSLSASRLFSGSRASRVLGLLGFSDSDSWILGTILKFSETLESPSAETESEKPRLAETPRNPKNPRARRTKKPEKPREQPRNREANQARLPVTGNSARSAWGLDGWAGHDFARAGKSLRKTSKLRKARQIEKTKIKQPDKFIGFGGRPFFGWKKQRAEKKNRQIGGSWYCGARETYENPRA